MFCQWYKYNIAWNDKKCKDVSVVQILYFRLRPTGNLWSKSLHNLPSNIRLDGNMSTRLKAVANLNILEDF